MIWIYNDTVYLICHWIVFNGYNFCILNIFFPFLEISEAVICNTIEVEPASFQIQATQYHALAGARRAVMRGLTPPPLSEFLNDTGNTLFLDRVFGGFHRFYNASDASEVCYFETKTFLSLKVNSTLQFVIIVGTVVTVFRVWIFFNPKNKKIRMEYIHSSIASKEMIE